MIRSGIEALSKDFGISKQTTEDIISTMMEHVQQDVKSFSKSERRNNSGEPMTDKEKILGLEKMVEDKVTENNLNLNEVSNMTKKPMVTDTGEIFVGNMQRETIINQNFNYCCVYCKNTRLNRITSAKTFRISGVAV